MKQQERDEQEFAFIREKIKDKPINRRRLLMRTGFNLFCAVLFGMTSCFVFVLLKPHMEEWLYPKQDSTISIPKDVLPQEEGEAMQNPKEEDLEKTNGTQTPSQEGQDNPQGEQNNPTGEGNSQGEQNNPTGEGNSQGEQNNPTGEGNSQASESQSASVKELELEDFQKLQNRLYAVGKQANKSVVTVTGVTSGMDWFDTPYENENRSAGIIIGNNNQELLILTEKKVIADAQAIRITFIDETEVSAFLKKYDGNTGIAVIAVPLTEVSPQTMKRIEVAALGNSYMIDQGTVVIAIGSPLGASYSILCGTITSSQNKVSAIDTNYTIFTTDIVGSENGSGALINLEGEIIGLLLQGYSSQNDRNTITALSISELKQVIEDLSNNRDIAYVGLRVSTATDEIAKQYGIPKGVYIKSVELDSPAMGAGLQEADVITAINGEEIKTVNQYYQTIYSKKPEDVITVKIKRQNGEGYVDLECAVTIGILQ